MITDASKLRTCLRAAADTCEKWPANHGNFIQVGYPPEPIISNPAFEGWAAGYGQPVDAPAACDLFRRLFSKRGLDWDSMLNANPPLAAVVLRTLANEVA